MAVSAGYGATPAALSSLQWSRCARGVLCGALLILTLCVLPAMSRARPSESAPAVLVAAVPASFPPEYSLDEDGQPRGFAIDLMNRIAERAALRVTYRVFDGWPGVQQALRKGEADLVPILGITPDRLQGLAFSHPVETFAVSLYVRASTNDVHEVSDLDGRQVAVVETNAAIGVLERRSGIQLQVVPSIDEALLRLLAGDVDAIAYPEPVVDWLVQRSGLDDRIRVLGQPLLEVKRAVAVRKDKADLLPRISAAVEHLLASKEYGRIHSKWYSRPAPYWTVRRVAYGMGAAMLLIVFLGSAWWFASIYRINQRLREQIEERDRAIGQREHFQEEMLASETRFRTLVENPLQAVVVHRGGHVLFANQAFLDLYGCGTLEELQAIADISERYHPDDREAVLAHRAKVERGQQPPRIEFRIDRPDGTTVWVSGNAARVRWEGEIAHQITWVDITARKEATAVLENFFHVSNEGLVVADERGAILRHNPAFAIALGYEATELLGRNLFDLIEPEDLEATRDLTRTTLKPDGVAQVINFENRFRRKDGSVVWFSWNVALGRDRIAYCSARDVTKQKQVDAQLIAERNRTRQIIEQSADGIVVIDEQGKVAFANPAACELFGLDYDALIGAPFGLPSFRDAVEISVPRAGGVRLVEMRASQVAWEGKPATLASLRDVTEQRQRDQDRMRLAAAVEQAADTIVMTDADGIITYVNPAFERTTGYTSREALGQTPRINNSGVHDRQFFTDLWQTITAGHVWRGQITNRCKDGSEVVEDVTISPALDEAGEIMNFICVRHDVTERNQAEAELRKHQMLLQAVFDGMPLGLLVIEPVGRRIVSANAAVEALFGYRPEELLGHSTEALHVDREHFEAFGRRGNPYLEQEGHWSTEFAMRRKDGSVFPTENHVTLLRDEQGGWQHAVSIVADISARKQAESELVEREERFRAIIDNSVDVITLIDEEARIVLESPSVRQVLGYEPEELVGRNAFELVHPDDVQSTLAIIQEGFAAGPGVQRETRLRMRHKDGSWRLMEARGRSLAPSAGGAQAVVNSRDVTEQQRLETQLRQSQKMEAIGVLAGGVAHDFNNLLSIILSYSELMLEQLHDEDPIRDDVVHIVTAGQRATGLTRQLLAFSRRQILKMEVLELGEIVVGTEKMLRRLIGEDVELTVRTSEGSHLVIADAGQVEQIVMNLVVNARDAMPTGGHLTIGIDNLELDSLYASQHVDVSPGAYVMLTVSDTGIGMDEATRGRIFEPFFTTKEQGRGTGLGLSTVYGIVQQFEGSIRVYSEPGHGTTFRIYLPRQDAPREGAQQSKPAGEPAGGSETVLVVEDEPDVRTAACRMLRRYGYTVIEAGNAGEAILLCEQNGRNIDLMLTDVVMPKMSGRELADRVHDMMPHVRTLYMSGYTDDAVLRHGALDAGVQLLQKPFTRESLLGAVRQALDANATKP